jgi:hypothetical protein
VAEITLSDQNISGDIKKELGIYSMNENLQTTELVAPYKQNGRLHPK